MIPVITTTTVPVPVPIPTVLSLRNELFSHGILPIDLFQFSSIDIFLFTAKLAKFQLDSATNNNNNNSNTNNPNTIITAALTNVVDANALKYSSWLRYSNEYYNNNNNNNVSTGSSNVSTGSINNLENHSKTYFELYLIILKYINTTNTANNSNNNSNNNHHHHTKYLLSVDYSEFILFLFMQKYRLYSNNNNNNNTTNNNNYNILTAIEFLFTNLTIILLLIRDVHKHLELKSININSNTSSNNTTINTIPIEEHEFNRLKLIFQFQSNSSNCQLFQSNNNNSVVSLLDCKSYLIDQLNKLKQQSSSLSQSQSSLLVLNPNLTIINNIKSQSKHYNSNPANNSPNNSNRDLLIRHCSYSYFYFNSTSRLVTLDSINNSIINLGLITGPVLLTNSHHSTITVISNKSIYIYNCQFLRIYTHTNNRPIIFNYSGAANNSNNNNSRGIVLAPYNTYYPELLTELTNNSIPINSNCWNSPIILESIPVPNVSNNNNTPNTATATVFKPQPPSPANTTNTAIVEEKSSVTTAAGQGQGRRSRSNSNSTGGAVNRSRSASPAMGANNNSTNQSQSTPPPQIDIVSLLPAEEFFPTAYPFNNNNNSTDNTNISNPTTTTTSNPFPLPLNYITALNNRYNQALINRTIIDTAELTNTERSELNNLVSREFQSWLSQQYPQQYLENLLRLDIQSQATATVTAISTVSSIQK